jgi:hypothetical protein
LPRVFDLFKGNRNVLGLADTDLVREIRVKIADLVWRAEYVRGMRDRDFAWKVRRRMFHDRNPLLTVVQDKCKVKEYARARGVKTARLLYGTDRPETIPFEDLPPNCFIKANHGAQWNIIRMESEFYWFGDGSGLIAGQGPDLSREHAARYRLTREQCVSLCQKWLRRRWLGREWAYRDIPPSIVVEESLTSRDEGLLLDYRLYTFRGVVKAISLGSAQYRRNGLNVFLDPTWKPFSLTKYKERLPDPLPEKPDSLEQMILTAGQLGQELDFARIDLYDTTQGVVLGEMTLYPESGRRNTPTACPVFNKWLGDQWVQPGENSH